MRKLAAAVVIAAFASACQTGVSPNPRAKATPKATIAGTPKPGATSKPAADLVRITGAVRLVSNNGAAVISNNGGAIVSNNGGALVSNNGGALVSNNGGGLVSNNGSGLVANNRSPYRLAARAPEALLADAELAVLDAAGVAVSGPDGKPVVARTDKQGRYALTAALPAGNLVLRVKLWSGGEVRAMLVRGGAASLELDVGTASSLGAAIVLDGMVKGDQALLDKLPATEAARLTQALETSRELLAAAVSYEPARLAEAATELRGKAPAVDQAVKAIEAILLGLARLGDGRLATQVPLNRPYAVLYDRTGRLLISEASLGRIRAVDREGLITTWADKVRGTIKQDFLDITGFAEGPDGSIFVLANDRLHRIRPDGSVGTVFEAAAWTEPGLQVDCVAVGPDGTAYVGGAVPGEMDSWQPRWIKVPPGGGPAAMPELGVGPGGIEALLATPDGTLLALRQGGPDVNGLWTISPGGASRLLAPGLRMDLYSALARAADGTVYFSEGEGTPEAPGRRVLAISTGGSVTPVPGPDAAGGDRLDQPGGLTLAPDGTLYVADFGTARVYARDPKGAWRAVAGVAEGAQVGDGRTLALNGPVAVTFDALGRMLITENGRHRVVRLEDGRLTPIVGSTEGFAGDGGPAIQARFSGITGTVARGAELTLLDAVNHRLRRVDAAGIVTTLAGRQEGLPAVLGAVKPDEARLQQAVGLALDAEGRPYWTVPAVGQLQRLSLGAEPRVEQVAGKPPTALAAPGLADFLADVLRDGEPAAESTLRYPLGLAFDAKGDLFVADTAHMQVRKVTGLGGVRPTISPAVGRGVGSLPEVFGDPSLAGRDGQALAVDLAVPAGLAFDAAGNLYVGELGTRRLDLLKDVFNVSIGIPADALPAVPARVRKVTPDGRVTTIAGPGGRFFTDPDAEDALVMPATIAVAPDGRLVIADIGANLVRILPAGSY